MFWFISGKKQASGFKVESTANGERGIRGGLGLSVFSRHHYFFKTSIVGQREADTGHKERNYGKAGDERCKRGGSRCESGIEKDLCFNAGS